MSDCMMFPKDWAKFIDDYSFEDKEEVYTNGSTLIPVFRVEQLIEHYFGRGWIPVADLLPEENDRYLCNVKSFAFPGCSYHAILHYDKNVGFREGNIYTDDVTHWMPLPEPPKEVGK